MSFFPNLALCYLILVTKSELYKGNKQLTLTIFPLTLTFNSLLLLCCKLYCYFFTLVILLIFATTEVHLWFSANKELPASLVIYKKKREVILHKLIPEHYEGIDPFPRGLTSRTSQPPQGHANWYQNLLSPCNTLSKYLQNSNVSRNLLPMKGPWGHVPTWSRRPARHCKSKI